MSSKSPDPIKHKNHKVTSTQQYGHAMLCVVYVDSKVYYPLQVLIIGWFIMLVNLTQVQADLKYLLL